MSIFVEGKDAKETFLVCLRFWITLRRILNGERLAACPADIVRPPQRLKRRKAGGGFPCDRWKRNPEQLEISGGFDVDTLSASDSVLAWDPVAEIWNGVGHLAEPRSKSPAFLNKSSLLRYWHAITTVQLKDVCPGNPQLKQSRSTSAPLQKVSS